MSIKESTTILRNRGLGTQLKRKFTKSKDKKGEKESRLNKLWVMVYLSTKWLSRKWLRKVLSGSCTKITSTALDGLELDKNLL